ncbi:MAG: hypothetical protein ABSG54_04965 [Terriglobia bacterium]|jgi:hypothetical protein
MEPIEILHHVTSKLTELGIPYMVGGSFASSLYGLARTTQDADLVVSLTQSQVPALVEAFTGQFYLDSTMIKDSLRHQTSFNIIHLESTFKIDFFPLQPGEFHQQSFSRRRLEPIDATLKVREYVQSAEDTVLYKLDWYRKGGGVSEVQWRDILGILKTQGAALDGDYLDRWARELGLAELLEGAKGEAGLR